MATDLKDMLNNLRPPQYTKLTDLRIQALYQVVSFERCNTRFGETIAATLVGHDSDDCYLKVYLPSRFLTVLNDSLIEKYNKEEGPRMSLQYLGKGKGVKFV